MAEISPSAPTSGTFARIPSVVALLGQRLWMSLLWAAASLIGGFSAQHDRHLHFAILMHRSPTGQAGTVLGLATALALWTYVFSLAGPVGVVAFWLALAYLVYRGAVDAR